VVLVERVSRKAPRCRRRCHEKAIWAGSFASNLVAASAQLEVSTTSPIEPSRVQFDCTTVVAIIAEVGPLGQLGSGIAAVRTAVKEDSSPPRTLRK
jgi:hypothetical protein